MNYMGSDSITLSRDVEVVAIPAGHSVELMKGTEVAITQALGGSYTLMVPTYGGLFRLADKDADAIGKEPRAKTEASDVPLEGEELEKEIWQRLKTCYDPEIPVNIVDLGLIYGMEISPVEQGKRVDVKMTLTAQGCGMGGSIAADAQNKLLGIPGITEADVQVVWDPPWTPEKISAEGRTLLGIR
jgi:probable FeS assembly SUF system protein SufT